MKQYRITTADLNQDSTDDAYLAPNDPIHELKQIQYLAGLGAHQRLQEYKALQATPNNITTTAAENARLMREKNIKPGTPEWFQLWFSRPYLTGEPKV